MNRRILTLAVMAIATAAFLVPALAQVREKALGAGDYETIAKGAQKAFEEKKFVSCSKQLKKLLALCSQMISDELVAKRPAAPEGFTAVPVKKSRATKNPYAAGMASVVGHTAEYRYDKDDGQGNVRVTITADSTVGQMLEAQFKFASMNPDIEVVKYGAHKALFTNKNKNMKLQILIDGLHYVEVNARGIDEDGLFAMFSQAFVDAVALVLG